MSLCLDRSQQIITRNARLGSDRWLEKSGGASPVSHSMADERWLEGLEERTNKWYSRDLPDFGVHPGLARGGLTVHLRYGHTSTGMAARDNAPSTDSKPLPAALAKLEAQIIELQIKVEFLEKQLRDQDDALVESVRRADRLERKFSELMELLEQSDEPVGPHLVKPPHY